MHTVSGGNLTGVQNHRTVKLERSPEATVTPLSLEVTTEEEVAPKEGFQAPKSTTGWLQDQYPYLRVGYFIWAPTLTYFESSNGYLNCSHMG